MKNHEVWFEDARSAYAKFELLKKYNLAGGGYWNLERPFPQSHILHYFHNLNSFFFVWL